jgi:hypothetical protein
MPGVTGCCAFIDAHDKIKNAAAIIFKNHFFISVYFFSFKMLRVLAGVGRFFAVIAYGLFFIEHFAF